VTLDGTDYTLYNTDQLVRPSRVHVFSNGCSVTGTDVFVLEYVAGRRGFASNVWSAERFVGTRPGFASCAQVYDRRFGAVDVYNHDQLVWPIPVPDPPHIWESGSAMLPHDQVVLEQARVGLGLTSRRWVMAHAHIAGNTLLPRVEVTKLDTALPRGVQEVLNTDQLRTLRSRIPAV
jgi:hypothetical protein